MVSVIAHLFKVRLSTSIMTDVFNFLKSMLFDFLVFVSHG